MTIPINTLYNIAISVLDLNGLLEDPTALSITIEPPTGSPITYTYPTDDEIVHPALGQFYVDFLFNQSGNWTWRWSGTLSTGASVIFNGGLTVNPAYETVTVHVQDESFNPVPGVNVSVFVTNVTVVSGGITSAGGNVVGALYPGTYSVELSKSMVGCSNPYSIEVADTGGVDPQTFNLTVSPLPITAPGSVNRVKLYGFLVESDGQPSVGVRVVVETVAFGSIRPWVQPPSSGSGVDPIDVMVKPEKKELKTDDTGYWEADVVPDSMIRVEILDVRFQTIFRVPNDPRITTLNIRDARPDPGTGQEVGITSDFGTRGMIGGES